MLKKPFDLATAWIQRERGIRIERILTRRHATTRCHPRLRLRGPDEKKFEIVRELTEIFRKQFEVIDIDGVRINFDGGWALIRASNTQPVLVLRFEAVSKERLKELVAIIKKQMENYKSIIQFDYEP